MKLFMFLLGCTPEGRHTEQHDVFFGIGGSVKELVPAMKDFWPEAKGKIHIDAYREVTCVDGYAVQVVLRDGAGPDGLAGAGVGSAADSVDGGRSDAGVELRLFFLNLGGYKPGEMEEFHYKLLAVSGSISGVLQAAKKTVFFKHNTFAGATSHVDDKYGVDVDDSYVVEDILPAAIRQQYRLELLPVGQAWQDDVNIGYFKLDSF